MKAGWVSALLFTERSVTVAAIALVASIILLGVRLSRRSTLQITVDGRSVRTEQGSSVYGLIDVAYLMALSMVAAGSATYLFSRQSGRIPSSPDPRRKHMWENRLGRLQGTEKRIYACVVELGGVAFQSDIVQSTGLSKATVSIALGRMEAKELLERRRSGLISIIVLR